MSALSASLPALARMLPKKKPGANLDLETEVKVTLTNIGETQPFVKMLTLLQNFPRDPNWELPSELLCYCTGPRLIDPAVSLLILNIDGIYSWCSCVCRR
jgi:hypothetical protein